jgi:hypothetical protein
MKVGDLVKLVLDESLGIVFQIEEIPSRGVYDKRIRYWVTWENGEMGWSWAEEVDLVQ